MRTNCRHYRVSQPCEPHKRFGARCDCAAYDPVGERILIVKLGALGDVLRTTTCLPPLKARYPQGHVTWVTRPNAVPLLEHNRDVDRILTIDSNYLELLLAEQFDIVIAPDAEALSASIAGLAHARMRYGFVADGRGGVVAMNDFAHGWWRLGLDDRAKRENRCTYGEWLYGICELPTPVVRPALHVPEEAIADARARLQHLSPHLQRWICFNTGAGSRWEEKRWKPAYYAALGERITAELRDTGVLLVGGPEEIDLNRELATAHPWLIDTGAQNSVTDFAALMAISDWVFTGDTLGYHVACAVDTPAFCVVGPTSPWELDAYGVNEIAYADMDCIACYLAKCPHRITCMDVLTPDRVWERVVRWRDGAAAHEARSA